MKRKKNGPKAKQPKKKPPTRQQIAAQAKAAVDSAFAAGSTSTKRKPMQFPGADALADSVFHMRLALNKYAQNIYTTVLGETIKKLQHAKRKNIV